MRFSFLIAIGVVVTLPYVNSLPCAEGACCKDGSILLNGTVCREAVDDCDVSEFCTGLSSDCPPDRFAAEETFCGSGLNRGVCADGTCMTEETIANYEVCGTHCSTERGKCTLKGLCVCNEGWQSPPECDKKTWEENVEKDTKSNMHEKREEPNQQVLNRNRRDEDTNVFRSRISCIESENTDDQHNKMKSIQDPPQKGTFTRLKDHPLFLPLIIIFVGFIILVAFTISAKILYQSELKAQWIRRRVKVEKKSSQIPKNVSKIDDATVNIDVGR